MGAGCSSPAKAAPNKEALLVVLCSPQGQDSASSHVAKAFAEAYQEAFPGDMVKFLDLTRKLPPFTAARALTRASSRSGDSKSSKSSSGNELDPSRALSLQFRSASKIVIAAPNWNNFLPDTLKQYLDHIVQPGIAFDATSQKGLLVGKPAIIIRSSGGPFDASTDTGLAYLYHILGFMGFADVRHVAVGNTDTPSREAALEAARKEAAQVAAAFRFTPNAQLPRLPVPFDPAPTAIGEAGPLPGRRVLLVTASPMGQQSATTQAAQEFVMALQEAQQDTEMTHLDLATLVEQGQLRDISALHAHARNTKVADANAALGADGAMEWWSSEKLARELAENDVLVFAVPMWNFTIPCSLARYLHHVLQPHCTFDPLTQKGLLPDGKMAFVVAASGWVSSLGGASDFLTPYMKQVLSLVGVERVHVTHISGTAGSGREKAVAAAVADLRRVAGI